MYPGAIPNCLQAIYTVMTNYYITSPGSIKRKDNTLLFEKNLTEVDGSNKTEKITIPVEGTRSLHLMGKNEIGTSCLAFLAKYGIPVYSYTRFNTLSGVWLPVPGGSIGANIVHQALHYIDEQKRLFLAKAFIEGSIHQMARNIRKYNPTERQTVAFLQDAAVKLQGARTVQNAMGFEGTARLAYYRAFFSTLTNGYSFHGRRKHPPPDPVNALISFGNAMVYTLVTNEIVALGLSPAVSYLHEPGDRPVSLALDLADIFKPLFVDVAVARALHDADTPYEFATSAAAGSCLIKGASKMRFAGEMEDRFNTTVQHRAYSRNVSYRELVRIECRKLLGHIKEETVYRPFKSWW